MKFRSPEEKQKWAKVLDLSYMSTMLDNFWLSQEGSFVASPSKRARPLGRQWLFQEQ